MIDPDKEARARAVEEYLSRFHPGDLKSSFFDHHPVLSTIILVGWVAFALGPVVLWLLGFGQHW